LPKNIVTKVVDAEKISIKPFISIFQVSGVNGILFISAI
jgi:hypothetical protein